MMKKTLLFCFIAFAVTTAKAQYTLNASFGNASGYTYLDGLNPVLHAGNQVDNCKKLIKLPNGHLLAVGSNRYTGDGNDLDYCYFEIDASGQDVAHYQHGTSDDEYLQDALVLNNVIYFCGYSKDAAGFYRGMIGKMDLATQTATVSLLPTAGYSQINGITTDGASLYFCGQSVEGMFFAGFTMKTDINLIGDNGYGFGGLAYTSFVPGSNHSEYFHDIIFTSDNNLLVAGSPIMPNSNNNGGAIKKINTWNGNDFPGFSTVILESTGTNYNFNTIVESTSDNSIIAVGDAQTFPAAPNGIIAVYNLDGSVKHNPEPKSCLSFNDVAVSNDRIVAVGNNGYESYIHSMLLPIFSADTDFNFTDGTDNFLSSMVPNFNMTLSGQTVLIDGNDLYAGGSLGEYWIAGNSAMAVSKYTSNGVGISENNSNTDFSVFPNPVVDVLNIESKNQKIESIEILNPIGQVIKSTTNSYSIDCSDLKSGSYFVRVNKNEVSKFNKL